MSPLNKKYIYLEKTLYIYNEFIIMVIFRRMLLNDIDSKLRIQKFIILELEK